MKQVLGSGEKNTKTSETKFGNLFIFGDSLLLSKSKSCTMGRTARLRRKDTVVIFFLPVLDTWPVTKAIPRKGAFEVED